MSMCTTVNHNTAHSKMNHSRQNWIYKQALWIYTHMQNLTMIGEGDEGTGAPKFPDFVKITVSRQIFTHSGYNI